MYMGSEDEQENIYKLKILFHTFKWTNVVQLHASRKRGADHSKWKCELRG